MITLNSRLTVRLATTRDAYRIGETLVDNIKANVVDNTVSQRFVEAHTPKSIHEKILGSYQYYLCQIDGEVAYIAALNVNRLHNFFAVRPGSGYARPLLEYVLDKIRIKGFQTCLLNAAFNAVPIFKRLQFVQSRPSYQNKRYGLESFPMQRKLI